MKNRLVPLLLAACLALCLVAPLSLAHLPPASASLDSPMARSSNQTLPLAGVGNTIIGNYLNSLRRFYSLTRPGFTLSLTATETDEEALNYVKFASPLDGVNPVVFAVTNNNILLANPPPPSTYLSIPVVAVALIPILNFPTPLNVALDPIALDGIISGDIVRWNDPYLISINPTISLPNQPITLYYPSSPTLYSTLAHILLNYGVQTQLSLSPVAIAVDSTYDVLLAVAAKQYTLGISDFATAIRSEWSQRGQLYSKSQTPVSITAQTLNNAVNAGPTTLINFIDISNSDASLSWPWAFYSCVTIDTSAQGSCDYRGQLVSFLDWALSNSQASSSALTYGFAPLSYNLQSNVLVAMQSFLCDGKPVVSGQAITIQASGATFPSIFYTEACYLYRFVNPKYMFSYSPVGSGRGIRDIIAKAVDFAGTDSPLTPKDAAAGKDLSTFPIVAGAVVMVYNIPGVSSNIGLPRLILSREVLANIYLGVIDNWGHPDIAALNPALQGLLPNRKILVAQRLDSSGTTYIFSTALSRFSAAFATTVGRGNIMNLPIDPAFVRKGSGNAGVLAAVATNEFCIGYVVLGDAMGGALPYAELINKAGSTLTATQRTIQAAIDAFPEAPLVYDIMDAPGEFSYPITGFTYILLHNTTGSCTKIRPILDFLLWMLSSPISLETAGELGFAILSAQKSAEVRTLLNQVKCDGIPAIRNCGSGERFSMESSSCEACPAGTKAVGLDLPCEACPPGTYSTGKSTNCLKCPYGTYTNTSESAACTSCPPNSVTYITGGQSIMDCVCMNMTLPSSTSLLEGANSTLECIPAGVGDTGVCATLKVDADGYPMPGYWLNINNEVIQCIPSYACLGGEQNACKDGFTGEACSECDGDYARVGQDCMKCNGSSPFGAIVIFLVSCIFCYFCSRCQVHTLEATLNFLQFASVISILRVQWTSDFLAALFKCLPANWIVYLFGARCHADYDYFFGFVTRIILPFLSIGVVSAVFLLYLPVRALLLLILPQDSALRDKLDKNFAGKVLHSSHHAISAVLIQVIFYSNEASLEYFKCVDGEDRDVLLTDTSVVCRDGSWDDLRPIAVLGIVLHMILVPLAIVRISYQGTRAKASDHEFMNRYGLLTSRFKHSHMWWEGFVAIRRVVVYALVVYLADDPHKCVVVVSSILLLSLAFQLQQRPFATSTAAFVENFLLACNYALLQVALMEQHREESSSSSTNSAGLAIFSIAIIAGVSVNVSEILAHLVPSQAMTLKDPIAFVAPPWLLGTSDLVEKQKQGPGRIR